MEENTKGTENNTQLENGGTEQEQGKNKMFTQDEVNGIVQSRLGQMRKQAAKEVETEYNSKLQELNAREMKIAVKEALSERSMPMELADLITCTDANDMKNKLDTIQRIYGNKTEAVTEKKQIGGFRIGADGQSGCGYRAAGKDPLRKAMGLNERDD